MLHPLMAMAVEGLRPVDSVCEFGNQRCGIEGFETAKEFYESIGVKRYVALDVNESKDAIVADLNYPVRLDERFDLVTNNGTSEHVFNQLAVFENAHNLTKGLMIHCVPFSPWLNHGFYNYNPILFADLAVANNYRADIKIANREGMAAALELEQVLAFKTRDSGALRKAVRELGKALLIVIFKKTNDEPFRIPFQGKYKRAIASDEMKARYA